MPLSITLEGRTTHRDGFKRWGVQRHNILMKQYNPLICCCVWLSDAFTCRLLWHAGLWAAVRWLCTHFPKRRRQEESEGAQVWGHDGGLSSRQLEQEVCWQEPWHGFFSTDTNLHSTGVRLLFKMSCETLRKKMSGVKFHPDTWQSRFQWGWPDSTPWCTLGDRSLDPVVQSLHRGKRLF